MDAVGFVLIVVGALLVAEQVLALYSGMIIATAVDLSKMTVNYMIGRIGLVLIVAGVLVRYFG